MRKNQAEIQIEALADVFNIATEGFAKFYKEAENSASGRHSTAASSGQGSKAASLGYRSTAASSGDGSTAASSGQGSKAASSGDYSKAASSGDYSKAASSGDYSKAASSGHGSTAASSGQGSKAASSGDYSKAASSGYRSTAASSGEGSTAASSGHDSTATSSGDYSKAASSGDYSKAASSGHGSTAASSGDYSTAASSGKYSACAALGYRAAVRGEIGNLLMASEYEEIDNDFLLIGGKADLVDGKKLKPGRWYIVEGGEWVEVDFTDNIFAYVLSNKKGVKKVETEEGKILYIVEDENGNAAHGETIKQAKEDLIYKSIARHDAPIPAKTTGKEWVGIYRGITGACSAGVKIFVEKLNRDLNDVYTSDEVIALTHGQYGAEKFKEAVNARMNSDT